MTSKFYTDSNIQIPLADVQHVEFHELGLIVVTCHTKYNYEHDTWENNAYVELKGAQRFLDLWALYKETQAQNSPS